MIVLGLLLLGLTVAVGTDVVIENTGSIDLHAFGQVFTLSLGWAFAAGALTAAACVLGIALLGRGVAGSRRRRAALKETRGSAEQLKAERDRLKVDLARERAERAEAEHETALVPDSDAESRVVDVRRSVSRRS
jgi:hypothetical protein